MMVLLLKSIIPNIIIKIKMMAAVVPTMAIQILSAHFGMSHGSIMRSLEESTKHQGLFSTLPGFLKMEKNVLLL